MSFYLFKRFCLLPITLFWILIINFILLNIAPGDPVEQLTISETGEILQGESGFVGDHPYLQFREYYGLTLPIVINTWLSIKETQVLVALEKISSPELFQNFSKYNKYKQTWGDRAKYISTYLEQKMNDASLPFKIRKEAALLLIRAGIRQGKVGFSLSSEDKLQNHQIAENNFKLHKMRIFENDPREIALQKINELNLWMQENRHWMIPKHLLKERLKIFFFETRVSKYFKKLFSLDFGTLRTDANKLVIKEVGKRLKYSLTLTALPLAISFFLCIGTGLWMATHRNKPSDFFLSFTFLIFYALPIYVVALFLIEACSLRFSFLPLGGFQSSEETYLGLSSFERLKDICSHLVLPLITLIYGSLAMQSRLSRTVFLEILNQDYFLAAKAKGLPKRVLFFQHLGKNAAITLLTALFASLGTLLTGSLIVETLFEIDGFGKFFYNAVINRDYNVVLFSTLVGSLLALGGNFAADFFYCILDPRVTLE